MNRELKHRRRLVAAACLIGAAAAARAEAPVLDFDQAPPRVGQILEPAREGLAGRPSDVRPASIGGIRDDRDCATVAFAPSGPSVSDAVWLRSTEWVTECQTVPGDPRHGGGWQNCWERPSFTYEKKVQAEIVGAKPVYPWERQAFEACLQGPWLDFRPIAAAYDYGVGGDGNGYYTLTPGKRTPMDPDGGGIAAGALVNTGRGFALDFKDRWSSYYGAGETTVLHVDLRKDGWFGGSTVVEADVRFAPAAAYRVDFATLGAALESGKKYFVKWSFQRIGAVSRPTKMKGGETDKTAYSPALAADW